MGGKRPDQYRIDPADSMATDDKWGPGHADEHLKDEDKSKYKESRAEAKSEGKIPSHGVNPAMQELRDVKMRSREEAERGEQQKSKRSRNK